MEGGVVVVEWEDWMGMRTRLLVGRWGMRERMEGTRAEVM